MMSLPHGLARSSTCPPPLPPLTRGGSVCSDSCRRGGCCPSVPRRSVRPGPLSTRDCTRCSLSLTRHQCRITGPPCSVPLLHLVNQCRSVTPISPCGATWPSSPVVWYPLSPILRPAVPPLTLA
uniref:Uncharacterized protein n=1 Tax=Cacopsylla melanoneura TaxID=428564 RepID=A0A8D8UUY6_9HEMI